MTVESLYRCLDYSLSESALTQRLTEAIATHLEVDWVCLNLHLGSAPSLKAGWPHAADYDWSQFSSTPKQIEIYSDLAKTPYADRLQGAIQIQAIAILPIPGQTQAQGWLWVGTEDTLPDLDRLKSVLPPLSIALDWLFLKAEKQRHQGYEALMVQISQLVEQESQTNTLLQRSIALATPALQADRAMACLLKYQHPLHSRGDRQKIPTATVQLITTEPEKHSFPNQWSLDTCDVCQQAWLHAPRLWSQEDLVDANLNSPLITPQDRSILLAPLMGNQSSDYYGSTVLGFLIWTWSSPQQWQADEQQLMKFTAHQLSTAIIHHQALLQVQSIVDKQTAQLKWSLDVQAKLGAKMRQQIQQLRHLNTLKDEFLSSMSHELNTPLTTMRMAVKMLKQPGRSPEKQNTYLDILEQELARESKLIKDLLKLQHFESDHFTLNPERVLLNTMLEKMKEDFDHRWYPLKGLSLELAFKSNNLANEIHMETDVESLTNAISELLVNAGKYSEPNTTVHLAIASTTQTPAQITMRLCNDGTGIKADEQAHIFDKFRRGAGVTASAIAGTGLGLALVKALVEQLEGSISVTSQPNQDDENYHTCFTLIFPQSMTGI